MLDKGCYTIMNKKSTEIFLDTERKIQKNFIELLNNKDINRITVTELCKKSKINRSTFYAHYVDIYDLLEKLETSMNEKIVSHCSPEELGDILFTSEKFFLPFLKFIKNNKNFYKACLQKRKNFPIEEGSSRIFNLVVKPHCLKNNITDEDKMMYYFVFFQAGITMVLKRWVDNDCVDSEEDICKIIINCLPI